MSDSPAVHALQSALQANPSAARLFAAPAQEDEVAAFAASVRVAVPEAFLAFHRLHDGTATALFSDLRWRSLREALRAKEMWDGVARAAEGDRVALVGPAGYWHSSWIPFLHTDDLEGALCTEPCFGRPAGQIVLFDWRGDDGWSVESPDLESFLAALAVAITGGFIEQPYDEELRERLRGPRVRVPFPSSEGLLERFDQLAPEVPAPRSFAPGEAVRLVGGPMQGFDGVVLRQLTPTRYGVRAKVFGKSVEVEVKAWELAPR